MEKQQPNIVNLLDPQSINPFDTTMSGGPRNLMFARMSENIDAQNRLALESGTLPPEEEALIRENLFPPEVTYLRASNVGKSVPVPLPVGNWKHTPNYVSTRGMILAMPFGESAEVSSDCTEHHKPSPYHAAIDKPRTNPSKLLMSLMKKVK